MSKYQMCQDPNCVGGPNCVENGWEEAKAACLRKQQNPIQELQDLFRSLDAEPDATSEKDIADTIAWLQAEAGELWKAVRRERVRERMLDELADVGNLWIILSVRMGVPADELLNRCEMKLKERSERYPKKGGQHE